jgi:leader peptidase (prepilin peptidase)/N-methyltransferase
VMGVFQNAVVFIFGAMMGSAANALIDRLPKKESWLSGRSHCDICKQVLEWNDLLPIFSYLNLKGRCRYCHSPIPQRNLWVEVFLGLGFLLIFNFQFSIFNQFSTFKLFLLMGILWVTAIIAVMDWETKLVSEAMVGVWAVLVIISQFSIFNFQSIFKFSNYQNNLLGLMIGVGVIGGIWAVTRGKAMGEGDVEIAAVLGWWLGWQSITVALWVAFVSGAVVGVIKITKGLSKLRDEIAFGPFLVIGGWVGYFWGDKLLSLLRY